MENNNNGGFTLFIASWLLNIMFIMDRQTITFILGSIATICAIVNYGIVIYKNTRKKKPGENN